MQTTQMKSSFAGNAQALGATNGGRTVAFFKKAAPAGTKEIKKAVAPLKKAVVPLKKAVAPLRKAATKVIKKAPAPLRKLASKGGSSGNDALWLPNTTRPSWLDGKMPGDRGFDPLGLSKPAEYLQVSLDSLNQNKAVNKAGGVVGKYLPAKGSVSTARLQPYDEVFGLARFRETELIHGRWAMLATLGVIIAEATTGVAWQDAGKVELDGAQYLGFSLPFTVTQLTIIEALLVGGAEVYRNTELAPEKRIYPGGAFDPLKLTETSPERTFNLKTAEIKHGRLAMIAFLGFGVQALSQGEGALGSLAKFATAFE